MMPNIARASLRIHVNGFANTKAKPMDYSPILHCSNRCVNVGLFARDGIRKFTTVPSPMREYQPWKQQQQQYEEEVPENAQNAQNSEQVQTFAKQPRMQIYRANQIPEKGVAISLAYSSKSKAIFLDATKQKGGKLPPGTTGNQFDWENKIVMKLKSPDLGRWLTVLNGKEKEADLIHVTEQEGVKVMQTLKLQAPAAPYNSYPVRVSRKVGDDAVQSVHIFVNISEALVLEEFIRASIRASMGFNETN